MLRYVIRFIFLFSLFLISTSFPHPVEALTKTFTDDFSTTPDGLFPSNWIIKNDTQASSVCANTWKVNNGVLKVKTNGDCTSNIIPKDDVWDNLGDNYIYELDETFVSGTDHNLLFRLSEGNNGTDWYGLHFQSPNDVSLERFGDGKYNVFLQGNYPNRELPYHIKVLVSNSNVKVYIDNVLVKDYTSNVDVFPHGRIALKVSGNSETWFDNISVTAIDPSTVLSVPSLKQTDPLWKNNVYDSASIWAPASPGIGAWGCALTSAAMVFQYHGITKLPNSTSLTPGTLNTWLKNEQDGYVGNGLINWLALSRLSRVAKAQNPTFLYDALEYRRLGVNKQQLISDIGNNIPAILEEPGHFIVGKGTDGTAIFINDPFYNRTDLSSYGDTFLSLGRFIPSHTDLSYIMLVINKDITVSLKDSQGQDIGDQFIQQPYGNALTGNGTNASPLKIVYVPVPLTGNYTVTLQSIKSTLYNFSSYLYDKNGEVKISNHSGIISPDSPDSFTLYSDHDNKSNSLDTQVVTFDNLLADLTEAYNLKLVTQKAAYDNIKIQIQNAQKDAKNKKTQNEITRLKALEVLINQLKGITIKSPADTILLYDIQYLEAHP